MKSVSDDVGGIQDRLYLLVRFDQPRAMEANTSLYWDVAWNSSRRCRPWMDNWPGWLEQSRCRHRTLERHWK